MCVQEGECVRGMRVQGVCEGCECDTGGVSVQGVGV